MKLPFLTVAAALVLTGCTTPYPNGSPIRGATLDANRAPRGSDAFCRTYGRQTAGNAYETASDPGDGAGANLIEAQRARNAGDSAYRRCLDGRTG